MCTFNLLFIRHLGIRLVVDFMFQVVLFVAHPFKFSMKYPRDLISTKFYEVPSVHSFSRFSWVLNGCFFQVNFLLQAKMFKFMNDFVLYWFPCFASFKVYPPSPYLHNIEFVSNSTKQRITFSSSIQTQPIYWLQLKIPNASQSGQPRPHWLVKSGGPNSLVVLSPDSSFAKRNHLALFVVARPGVVNRFAFPIPNKSPSIIIISKRNPLN